MVGAGEVGNLWRWEGEAGVRLSFRQRLIFLVARIVERNAPDREIKGGDALRKQETCSRAAYGADFRPHGNSCGYSLTFVAADVSRLKTHGR